MTINWISPIKWVEALKSGTYRQGKTFLRKGGAGHGGEESLCCLGVLCEESGVPSVKREWGHASEGWEYEYLFDDGRSKTSIRRPGWMEENTMQNLMAINDGSSDFEEVITYIEENIIPGYESGYEYWLEDRDQEGVDHV